MTQRDLFAEDQPSRYVVGIDLGTTNSAVCYVDTQESPWRVRVFPVVQLIAPGQVEARETLPSFHYQPTSAERGGDALQLPWQTRPAEYVVGTMARDHAQLTPGRIIASAKSWLSHSGVDRTADLLPWHGAEDVERLSPIEVSARYLQHIRQAWDAQFPDAPLSQQDVVLTLPASFDEVARELTVQAATRADLPRVVLIEEPQAAFYAWVNAQGDRWREQVEPGQKILVCDIGGGTTDFTLIRVRQSQAAGDPPGTVQFHRVAVGEHLILGGDNLDLALAHHLEQRLVASADTRLPPRQWEVLVRSCRQAKETLLGATPPEQYTLHLPGTGARLVGGGLQVEVTRQEAQAVLVDGFFPAGPLAARPSARQSGFREFGLPYAADPAVTRYLAAFLTAHRHAGLAGEEPPTTHDPARPDLVLFNGGLFASPQIKQRIVQVLEQWFRTPTDNHWSPTVLENDRLDLAVARGAAYYGMVRRGEGVAIAAGLARSYYVEAATGESQTAAVCLIPGRAQPGETIDLAERRFELQISEPVEFPLYVSSTRLDDEPGEVVEIDPEQMKPLAPIRTALRTQRRSDRGTVPVQLHARLSEIGTMELWCSEVQGHRSWRLQFDIRSATETDRQATQTTGEQQGIVDETVAQACHQLIAETFEKDGQRKPSTLVKQLVETTGQTRDQWPMSLLRRLWESLIEFDAGRRQSQQHEARWLHLIGFTLRPGYGMAVDDWRVAETWRLVQGKVAHHSALCRNEQWILWRRVAGGLPSGQQRALAEPLLASVRALHRRMTGGHVRGEVNFSIPESNELWRLLGSLELLPVASKHELGKMLLELAPKRKMQPVRHALVWALGRLGSRQPVYGPLNTVVDAAQASQWVQQLMTLDVDPATLQLALMQLARRTDDRYRDLDPQVRQNVAQWLADSNAPGHLQQLVSEGGQLETDEQNRVFGETLPRGLRIG